MILIIGYGNLLRNDDGVGCYVANQLGSYLHRYDIEILAHHQLTVELVEPISRADFVIFIDAREGGQPGEIMSTAVERLPLMGAFTHHVTPATLLVGAYELYGTAPEAMVLSVTGMDFAYGETFSEPVWLALPELYGLIQLLVDNLIVLDMRGCR